MERVQSLQCQFFPTTSQNHFSPSPKLFSSRDGYPLQGIKLNAPILGSKMQTVAGKVPAIAVFMGSVHFMNFLKRKIDEIFIPFKIGDMVTFRCEDRDITGIVEKIGFVTTTLYTVGEEVVVPTNKLAAGGTIWITDGSHAPIYFDFWAPLSMMLKYVPLAQKTKAIINEISGVKRNTPKIFLNEIMEDKVHIMVCCKVKNDGLDAYLFTKSKIMVTVANMFT